MKFINLFNKKNLSLLVFFTIFSIGISVYKDYGVSIDDQIYLTNGQYYYQYIKSLFTEVDNEYLENLKALNEQLGGADIIIHPVVFEVPLIFLTNLFKIENINEIFEFSHLFNFLIFFSSLYFFYKLIIKRFSSYYYALFGVIFLFLSPRIFAESFYNSRDIFFLSLFIFNMYASVNFIKNTNYKNAFYFSLTSALIIDAKVIGILSPIIIFFLIFLKSLNNKTFFNNNYKCFIFVIFLIPILILLFWPYLWQSPFNNLFFAFTDIVREQNNLIIVNLYQGNYILSSDVPWHYRPLWFFITTPVIILILLTLGLAFIFSRVINRLINFDEKKENDLWKSNYEMFDLYCLIVVFSSFIITIFFNTSQFGGWRHLYYVYPSIIIISIYGIYRLKIFFTKFNTNFIIFLLIFLNYIYLTYWNIKFHPFQNIYFNLISKKYSINNFDLDYWGISHKSSLQYIIKHNKNYPIKVASMSFSNLETAKLSLNKDLSSKIIIVHDLNDADFIINNYMKRIRKNFTINNEKFEKYHEILIENKPISTIFKKK